MNMKRQPDPQPSSSRPQQPGISQPLATPGQPAVRPATQQQPGAQPPTTPTTAQSQPRQPTPHPLHPRTSVQRPRAGEPPAAPAGVDADDVKKGRLFSLDAYRGFVMLVLAASGFGILQLTQLPPEAPVWQQLDYDTWQRIGFNFDHTVWRSDFDWIGVSFWDLLQPAFMFIVGVAMPFSYARRQALGEGAISRATHAVLRAFVLILLGVFLSSNWSGQTNWTFVNVLSQIGLGYLFVYALMGRRFWIQLAVFVLILAGYWGWFFSYTPAADYNYATVGATEDTILADPFASWSKNANVAHDLDVWFLNKFPHPNNQPFTFNEGGYQTLNFVPAICTMLLGVFCGQLLLSERRWWQKFFLLVLGGGVCLGLGVLAGQYACPIVKRIWTPSWVLFSGAWVIWGLAAFYLLFDLCRLRWLAWPLVVVGMNSLAFYMMGQLMRPWAEKTFATHFTGLLAYWPGQTMLADDMFGRLVGPISAVIVFWLIALWMYRQKFFVRV
ncbi:MAG: acyltransferase family protein [Pirellulaceae bacterium]